MAIYEDVKKVVLSQNQQWLKDIDIAIRTRGSNPGEVARLKWAREDVASRMTAEEIAQYEASRGGLSAEATAAQLKKDMVEMESNRDKPSI